jgi:hypothetical protein
MGGLGSLFPRSVAQLTGVFVAGIVGFGTDSDLFVAIPLGVFAGSFTALVLYFSDDRPVRRRRIVRREPARREPPRYREPQPYREAPVYREAPSWSDANEQQTWREPPRQPRQQFGKKPSPRQAGWR